MPGRGHSCRDCRAPFEPKESRHRVLCQDCAETARNARHQAWRASRPELDESNPRQVLYVATLLRGRRNPRVGTVVRVTATERERNVLAAGTVFEHEDRRYQTSWEGGVLRFECIEENADDLEL